MNNREKIVRDLLVYGQCAYDQNGTHVDIKDVYDEQNKRNKPMKKRHYLYLGLTAGFILGMFCGIVAAHAEDHDASAVMPITAKIIQCGTRYEALGQCKSGVDACCVFAPVEIVAPELLNEITPSSGTSDVDHHGEQVTTEETDNGVIVNFE